ncbi:MAG: ABC transporter permease [Archangiaceae bacterium]|nr:ABC transporter permease [Archangiaceae bacterium]
MTPAEELVLPWRPAAKKGRGRLGLACLGGLVVTALGADLLASDLPLAVRVDAHTYLLPALTRPPQLRLSNQGTLAQTAEWQLGTPIPFGPNQTFATATGRTDAAPWAPDREHLLGTDELGRDVLARLIHGSRASLSIGFGAVLISLLVGLLLGVLAGWYRGLVDACLSRLTEMAFTFPTFFFFIALAGVLRFTSALPLVIGMGLLRWPDIARLARAETLKLRELDFVLAARVLGASDARILWRHVVPNALPPVLVAATFGVAGAILMECALAFLGIGVPAPTASWGELLFQAQRYLVHPGAWWLAVFPGLAVAGTVLTMNLVGEALQDLQSRS